MFYRRWQICLVAIAGCVFVWSLGSGAEAPVPKQGGQLQWEYKVVQMDLNPEKNGEELSKLSQDGWEWLSTSVYQPPAATLKPPQIVVIWKKAKR